MSYCFKGGKALSRESAMSSEWLDTNGLGGYASSTIINCNTRRYHGLLVVNLNEYADKLVLLSRLEEFLLLDGKEYSLSAAQYSGAFKDGGLTLLNKFILRTHPIFVYKIGKVVLMKEIAMPVGENTVLIKYTLINAKKAAIKLMPQVACRSFHALTQENSDINGKVAISVGGLKLDPYSGMPSIYFQVSEQYDFRAEPVWYRHLQYEEEERRGFDHTEDLYVPGSFIIPFKKNGEIIFGCSVDKLDTDLSVKWRKEVTRRHHLDAPVKISELQGQLKKAARMFMQKGPGDRALSVVAGYHWFLEWGRDAMISLPGLTLYSGMQEQCLSVLKKFAKQEHRGLIPNFLGKTRASNAYNSVDASLWFAWAVQQYYLLDGDVQAIKEDLWPTLKSIFSNFKNGTLHDIHMEDNGLIYAGDAFTNISWMDAMVDGKPATPRYGALVEVNALWFNMLCFMKKLARKFDDDIYSDIRSLVKRVKSAFSQVFWEQDLGYLKDFVNSEQQSASIRPNQIFAVSLPYSPLARKKAKRVVNVVKEHLLTNYGLRTLSQQDLSYIGVYRGDSSSRDRAYHNGTVWPWLLGNFGEALIKVTSRRHAIRVLEPCLNALGNHLATAGIGSISEVFDGDEPHSPGGCISQAWSVAEVLRLTHLL